jgi:hypothetical protein
MYHDNAAVEYTGKNTNMKMLTCYRDRTMAMAGSAGSEQEKMAAQAAQLRFVSMKINTSTSSPSNKRHMRRYDRRSASSSRSGRWRVLVSVRVWALN